MAAVDRFWWRSRVRGCLLAGALGDALGAGFEGHRAVSRKALERAVVASRRLRWTDDTALQLAVAGHLAGLRGPDDFDDDEHARALAAAWQAEPHRGYGANPPAIFSTVLADGDWRTAAAGSFSGQGSQGNGGAMRAAPFGAVGDDAETVAALARRGAAVTHAHPVGQDAAAVVAVAAMHALHVPEDQRLDGDELLTACLSQATTSAMRQAVAAVPATLHSTHPADVARVTGNGILADEAVAAALSAFLHHPRRPLSAITFAVGMGGDTDTIAAMAGSLSGACAGERAIPEGLLGRLERRADIEQVGDDLSRLAHHADERGHRR